MEQFSVKSKAVTSVREYGRLKCCGSKARISKVRRSKSGARLTLLSFRATLLKCYGAAIQLMPSSLCLTSPHYPKGGFLACVNALSAPIASEALCCILLI